MKTFHDIGVVFFNNISIFDAAIASTKMAELSFLGSIILSIFLTWRIIQIMLGSNQKPVSDVALEVIIWATVWGFAFNSTYLNMVTNGMNEIFTWAGGGISFFDQLDTWWEQLFKVADNLYVKDKSYIFPGRGIVALAVVTLAALILIGIPLLVILLSSIFLQILILVAPFMLFALLFPVLKKVFYNWIEAFIFIILTVLIISLIQNSMVSKIGGMLNGFLKISNSSSAGSIVSDSFVMLITCLLYAIILSLSVPIAKMLSGATGIRDRTKNL